MSFIALITIAVGVGTTIGGFIHKEFLVMGGGLALIFFSVYFLIEERRDSKQNRIGGKK